jgi:hypothetical protein
MKRLGQKASVLTLLLLALAVETQATEYRSPYPLERGPFRFLFGEEDDQQGYRFWTAAYTRNSDKAFTSDHGTTTEDLAALYFNKADFRLTEIFPESLISLKSEYYNPLLRTTNLHLRANYIEAGLVFGARWDMPFYHEKGRVGIRASVPVKRLKIEKVDVEGVRDGAQLQDVLSIQPASASVNEKSTLVRLDFAEALAQSGDRTSAINYGSSTTRLKIGSDISDVIEAAGAGADKFSVVANNVITGGGVIDDGVAVDAAANANVFRKIRPAVVYSPEGLIPREPDQYIVAKKGNAADWVPADGKISSGKKNYFARESLDYSLLGDEATGTDAKTRREKQAAKANLWLVPILGDDNEMLATGPKGSLGILKALSEQVTENAYEWMHDRGIDFEPYQKEGVGDLDVDLFYEYQFQENMVGEFSIGVRVPTAKKREYSSNPYYTPLGNGGHWELKAGGMVAWQPAKTIGLKGEAFYSVVLEATEERAASFKNALVKNIGPKADVDVDWNYFVARVDANLQHPSTSDITGTVGYEFFYKKAENLKFTKTKMQSWLGKKLTAGSFVDDTYELSSALATEDTQAIGHRVRWEASYIMSDWFELLWGGCWTFAGKNIPREFDGHLGFNIAF